MDGTTKPGYLTTEFWGKNIMHIIVFYNTFFHKNLDPNMGIAAMTALEVAYGAGRSLVKAFKDLVALYKSNFQKAPVVVVPAAGPTPAQ